MAIRKRVELAPNQLRSLAWNRTPTTDILPRAIRHARIACGRMVVVWDSHGDGGLVRSRNPNAPPTDERRLNGSRDRRR